jgi:glutaredoxin 2
VNRTINNDSSGSTTSQFGDSTSLLLDLFECSDLECFAELKSRMKKLNDEIKTNSALTAHVDRRECFIDATNRWLAPANAYQHSILNLCRLVAEIINVATANLSYEILEEVVKVFIVLNADANSFPFLAEVISRY